MTELVFYSREKQLVGFRIQGHTGYAESGQDIVCAAASSLTRFTVNLLTEDFRYQSELKVSEDTATIQFMLKYYDEMSDRILKGFRREAELVREEYPLYITIINTEV